MATSRKVVNRHYGRLLAAGRTKQKDGSKGQGRDSHGSILGCVRVRR
jgi:hypothetical protein